jgi:hypothetical protein
VFTQPNTLYWNYDTRIANQLELKKVIEFIDKNTSQNYGSGSTADDYFLNFTLNYEADVFLESSVELSFPKSRPLIPDGQVTASTKIQLEKLVGASYVSVDNTTIQIRLVKDSTPVRRQDGTVASGRTEPSVPDFERVQINGTFSSGTYRVRFSFNAAGTLPGNYFATFGLQYFNAKIDVIANMVGTTPAAFRDPTRGGELAISQFDRGVDVIFAAAGNTGTGVLQAAKDKGRFAIGVDSNQNHLHPGTMLTSMVKHVDTALYEAFKMVSQQQWKSGVVTYGLSNKGISLAMDEHNQKFISKELSARLKKAEEEIINGKIKVHDYVTNNACPV